MKKLGCLVMSLMSVSLLASCGGSTSSPTPSSYAVTVKAGEGGEFSEDVTEFTLNVAPNTKLLEDLSIIIKPTYVGDKKLSQIFDKFTYEDGNPIGAEDIVFSDGVTVIGTYRNKTLEECSWKEISDISALGAEEAEAFFGPVIENDAQGNAVRHSIEKTVTVNGQPHQVRIIGYGQDEDGEGNEIGITFEFKNLISDEGGFSLATQWNDTNEQNTASHNYLDSSLRMALVGEHEQDGHILWAQKEANAWTTNTLYRNKSVLDMLPFELASVLKTPSKYININDDGWSEQTVEDKLFLLSPREMNFNNTHQEPSTNTYSYYENAEEADRVKKQVNNKEAFTTEATINYVEASGQVYTGDVTNYAGYNENAGATGKGGNYWLRSPDISENKYASCIDFNGYVAFGTVYSNTRSVAPAFCI